MGRVLSGMRPTGRLHIGHLVGALDNWVDLQSKYDAYFFVADWHAITTNLNTDNIRENTVEMAKDWIAAGIDPEKSTLFIQSQVPEHAELHLIFSMLNNLPRLERLPTFKGQLQNLVGIKDSDKALTEEQLAKARSGISYGFLGYPVLQAADILLYSPDVVPVGEDQLPHIELTREIARRFNSTYKTDVFTEPSPLLTNTPRVLGTDGRKMSKSYGNTILPTDSLDEISKGVKRMITDTNRIRRDDPGNPDVCSVYDLHKAYTDPDEQIEIARNCRAGGIGCADCKTKVSSAIADQYGEYRESREALRGKEGEIVDILMEGSKKARLVTADKLGRAKEAMGFNYSAK